MIRIFNRIRCFEPNNKNVVKIMSCILLNEDDILELAFTCDSNLISRINAAKFMLGMPSTINPQLVDPFEPPYSFYNQESNSGKRSWPPRRICHYFMKGYCKFGENCRFEHPKSYAASDEHRSTTTLEELETEIVELLRSGRGRPVSIALLPTLYSAKYGKALHADGYLTESQRRGEVGCSLTKLLSRMRNSIHVVHSRPHGQHLIVLAEDAAKYAKCRRNERNETSAATTTCSSDQIYLTFSAESKFTIEDVADYFRQFGPVREVRIPCQDKRMFGFVSFYDADTVDEILRNRKPHYICRDRVLVKPYRANSRNGERSYMKKTKPANCYAYHQHLDPFIVPRESYWLPLPQSHLNSMAYSPFVSCNIKQVLEGSRKLIIQGQIVRLFVSCFRLLSKFKCEFFTLFSLMISQIQMNLNGRIILDMNLTTRTVDMEMMRVLNNHVTVVLIRREAKSNFQKALSHQNANFRQSYRDYKEKPRSVLQSIDRLIVRSRA
ncbi:zinc finger CCCH domain-containing protein 18-like isoform X3 [Ananas comosus]|nr:zinc finger CCCH domain-containing protein 18-like isoform X3 [Ananas comosus]